MIYGNLTLENWHNIRVGGEAPESFYEGSHLRLFFMAQFIIVIPCKQGLMILMQS